MGPHPKETAVSQNLSSLNSPVFFYRVSHCILGRVKFVSRQELCSEFMWAFNLLFGPPQRLNQTCLWVFECLLWRHGSAVACHKGQNFILVCILKSMLGCVVMKPRKKKTHWHVFNQSWLFKNKMCSQCIETAYSWVWQCFLYIFYIYCGNCQHMRVSSIFTWYKGPKNTGYQRCINKQVFWGASLWNIVHECSGFALHSWILKFLQQL